MTVPNFILVFLGSLGEIGGPACADPNIELFPFSQSPPLDDRDKSVLKQA